MNMNFLNKPPLNKIFGNKKVEGSKDIMKPETDFPISTEESAEIDNTFSGVNKGLSYALIGGMTVAQIFGNSAEASAAAPKTSLPEDFAAAKTTFVETMKTAPTANKDYEEALIKYAEHISPEQVKGSESVKEFKVGDARVAILYKNGLASTIRVQEMLKDTASSQSINNRAANYISLYDGYNGAPLDGVIDHTEITHGETTFSLLDGKKYEMIKSTGKNDFKLDSAGAHIQLPSSSEQGHDEAIYQYIKNQTHFTQVMKVAGKYAEKGNDLIAADMAQKALEKGTIQSVSTEQQAAIDAKLKNDKARFGNSIASTPDQQ
jgi:hypothetical protein